MLTPNPAIDTLALLGDFLRQFPDGQRNSTTGLGKVNDLYHKSFKDLLQKEHIYNPWFTPEWVDNAVAGIASMLEEEILQQWIGGYDIRLPDRDHARTVGLVLAGNIPLVGFHDMICVLVTGHNILAKPSSKDDRLIRMVADVISTLDPAMKERIRFTDDRLSGMNAVIATGSNNSARYFEYYFREIPHIIRRNRNGIAVLTGDETDSQLEGIGRDIFTYFGLGCRNVTKLYVPEDYDLKILLGVLDRFHQLGQHNKYANNVDYYRSIYLMNLQDFLDNGVLLFKEDHAIASPVGVVFYERYSEISSVQKQLEERAEEIQCVVSAHKEINGIPPGTTQEPMPWDYADGVDTIRFLTELP